MKKIFTHRSKRFNTLPVRQSQDRAEGREAAVDRVFIEGLAQPQGSPRQGTWRKGPVVLAQG